VLRYILVLLLLASVAYADSAHGVPVSTQAIASDDFTAYSNVQEYLASTMYTGVNRDTAHLQLDTVHTYNDHQTIRYVMPGGTDQVPQNTVAIQPSNSTWIRAVIRFEPGWTTVGTGLGSTGSTSAASYKLLNWGWNSPAGRGGTGYTNTAQQHLEWGVTWDSSSAYNSTTNAAPALEAISEWYDGEWYQYIVFYNQTSANTVEQRLYFGKANETPQLYSVITGTISPVPVMNRLILGANYNQVRNTGQTLYINYGQWEVINGSANPDPFGILQLQKDTTIPVILANNTSSTVGVNTVTVSLTTNEVSKCNFNSIYGTYYVNNPAQNRFQTIDGLAHTYIINTTENVTYSLYVKCADRAYNAHPVNFNYKINFTITPRTNSLPEDITGDGIVNLLDIMAIAPNIDKPITSLDLNADGTVNIFDLIAVVKKWGMTSS
jgi:hypothetical protein